MRVWPTRSLAVAVITVLVLSGIASVPVAYATGYVLDPNDPNSATVCQDMGGTWGDSSHNCTLNNDFSLGSGNYLRIDANASLTLSSGLNFRTDGGAVNNYGFLQIFGNVYNADPGQINNYADISNSGTIYDSGTLTNHGGGPNEGLFNYEAGAINVYNAFVNRDGGYIYNSGRITVYASNTTGAGFFNLGPAKVDNYGTIQNYGTLYTDGTTNNYAAITDYGFINNAAINNTGSLDIECGGTINNPDAVAPNPVNNDCQTTSTTTTPTSETGSGLGNSTSTNQQITNGSSVGESGSGDVPEFPASLAGTVVLTAIVLAAYLLVRDRKWALMGVEA